MESGITKEFTPAVAETQKVANADSVDSFQSFIYELFEKNGILNDLRAYLRGHIVNVLKSAQTGDPHPCQKHFTQRLELKNQAINILIAEYLMRLEFSYSFSVFVSEIPLANMVFGFAKSMMEGGLENKTELRFKESDIWSILNYLGVQCDSEHAANVVEMYKNDKQDPLLLCILKCMPLYKENVGVPQVSSDDSLSSARSVNSIEKKPHTKTTAQPERCRHYIFCKTCQNKMYRLKEMYKKKKKYLAKTCKDNPNVNSADLESLVNNINVMEKSLIDEMFQQLKCVYETEMEMVKIEEEKKVKRSMASHAIKLQKKRDEMEENFKAREAELERRVAAKKQFLWGLARALRSQHASMARAMRDVKTETHRLELKEDSLKSQLAEAEQILKQRGEEMRQQISNELTILESHLESMKKERENITKERSELENLRKVQNSASKVIKVHDMESEEVHSHYDLLRNELAILKKYLESSKLSAKCVIERGTITEPLQTPSKDTLTLNNSQGNEKCSKSDDVDDKVKTNQLVNDFRKKNVNFSQSKLDELYYERSRDRSRSSVSSEAGDNATPDLELERGRDRDLIQRLREENDRLKAFARQQCSQIEQMSVPTQLSTRPRTAPTSAVTHLYNSASVNALNVGWRKGAGEELSVFSDAQPRILVPGDTLPFIGVLRDRHGNARRSPIGSRSARPRPVPLPGVSKRATSPLRDRLSSSGAGSSGVTLPVASCSLQPDQESYQSPTRERQRPRTASSLEMKSSKSDRQTTELLRKKDSIISSPPMLLSRDKSPNAVLREAKLRLRKLEIEAEAVEKSYLDFRRKQSELRLERNARRQQDAIDDLSDSQLIDINSKLNPTHQSVEKLEEPCKNDKEQPFIDLHKSVRHDFEKYIREYKNKFNIGETHFRCKPTVTDKVKPIPQAYSNAKESDCKLQSDPQGNCLEMPLTEFRKLYTSARHLRREDTDNKYITRNIHSEKINVVSKTEYDTEDIARQDAIIKAQNKKQELEILKQNLSKMYNLNNNNLDFKTPADTPENEKCQEVAQVEDENILRVEVESTNELNNLKCKTEDLLVVVQSSVTAREMTLTSNEPPPDDVSAQMTIIVSPAPSLPRVPAEAGLSHGSPPTGPSTPSPSPSPRPRRSLSPEQAAHLTRNDVLDAIFHSEPDQQISSVHMRLELSKDVLDESVSDYEKGEYADDFSADVDNYNSRSDYENHSPISLPKTSEDENFWDT